MKRTDQLLASVCSPTWKAPRTVAHPPPVELDDALGPVLALAVHTSRASILITDADLDEPGPRIIYVNPAFETMSGYDSAEVVGRNPRLMQGPATDRRVLDRLRDDLTSGRHFEGETVNYRADGQPFIMSWRIGAVHNADGAVTHYVAIQDDVTEDRLQRYRENRLVQDLQTSLLPDLPHELDFLRVAGAYRPASGELPVGGDWYDAVARDGCVDLVVGDVAGHGVEAVAEMGRLRWTVNALLANGATPSHVAATVNASLDERGVYAALSIVRVLDDGRLEIVTCGAPPAALIASDGAIHFLGSQGPLLGLVADQPFTPAHATLRAGERLVLFSDGLTRNGRLELAELDAPLGVLREHDVRNGVQRLCEFGAEDDDTAVLVAELIG